MAQKPNKSAPKAAPADTLDVDLLWQMQRVGAANLSPDGAQAVCSVSTPSMADNKSRSALWLLSTLGGEPRQLTRCGDKDSQPQFSPRGDLVAFLAKREDGGVKDETTQLYLIAPDGGEARRAGVVATGVEAFKWFPDGRRVALLSWVWPHLKGTEAQAKAHTEHKARKETGVATSEANYRYWDHFMPVGRVVHLHVLDVHTGELTNLFEGSPLQLSRTEPDNTCFDISPDGKRIAFSHDVNPDQPIDGRNRISVIDVKTRRTSLLAKADDWHLTAPVWRGDGKRLAWLAAEVGRKHTLPNHLAVGDATGSTWSVVSSEWDHEVQAPLQWEEDGEAVLFAAEQQGRRHLWRFDLPDLRAEVVVEGGWLHAFHKVAGTLVTLADSASHPPQLRAHEPDGTAARIEHFNEELLARLNLGDTEEVWFTGALGDEVQMWLHYPPGFDRSRKYPVLHTIHGGPHTAPGDVWHWRWNNKVFAAQGYVVASVNYHGSSSFGHAFLDSITHRWGELELEDVEAATDWLLKKRWVDKRRIFATGGSYGGYMVAWMNGHVPAGRYAAYICHAGCYDWQAMFADDAWSWHAKELGAWYWEDPARIAAQSPHTYAGNFNTPTLVIHGALDYRVPDAQGLAYYNTLKARGIDSRLLWFPDENHWVLKPRNSAQWYGEFFAWLRRHDVATSKGKAGK
ncbi:S9 family peptidase [Ideonella margarita]|uniref:Acyl-peptide hydrolase n=1 Tax=Ideonella margarita TaxID=2984191 RepID=A0ABU9C009_9BURK